MKRLALLATVAVFALMPQAHAGALIANCTLKPNADVKSMPSAGDDHLFWKVPQELVVEVYDQSGSEWAYIHSEDKDNPAVGWVLRSSLSKCTNVKPWRNK